MDKDNKLKKLFQKIIIKFPELADYTFSIKYSDLSGAFAEYEYDIELKKVDIDIDSSLKHEADVLKIASIAHELSHILKEKDLSIIPMKLGYIIDDYLYEKFKFYKLYEERRADKETVKRGFGKELIELCIFDEKEYDEVYDGLSIKEIETMVKNEKMFAYSHF